MRDYGLQAAEDEIVFSRAAVENRILLSADTDFGTILALWKQKKPSIVLFRRGSDRDPGKQVSLLLSNLPTIKDILEEGSIVVLEQIRLRIRRLPITEE